MPLFPIRDLASKGILRDPSPYQLDLNAWSNGKGVRCHANKVQSAPIFRTIQDSISASPVFLAGYEPSTGYDAMFVVGADGSIGNYQGSTWTASISATYSVRAITITNGGAGYLVSAPPSVTFSAASGTGHVTALGTAIISDGGVLVGILMQENGWYPTGVAPTITIGSGAGTATCTLGYSTSADPRAVTGCFLGDVQYINQPSRAPQYFTPGATNFKNLPNMETAWRCRSLRSFGDFLIALNVTKPSSWTSPFNGITQAGGEFPNLFKWSDTTFVAQTPDSWDPDNPNTSAGENPLEQLTSPIVDGLALRNIFAIYTETEIWAAQQTQNQEVFQWQGLFSNGGLIAPNCVVEVDGVHYCFGPTDIYKHDGVSKVSIVDKRNRETIYRNLNVQASEVCFVRYVPHLDSIYFAYQTGDPTFTYTGVTGCNAAAVYDIANDTWTFIDLPNVFMMDMANADYIYTASNIPVGYTAENFGGSYYDQLNTFRKSSVAVQQALSGSVAANRLLGYDFVTNGWMGYAYTTDSNTPAFIERTGLALDQLGSNLQTYKRIRTILPLVTCFNNVPVQVTVGWSNTPSGAVTWGTPISFNPVTDYKVDTITGGRYLALRFTVPQPVDFEIAGFDVDVTEGGRR